MVGPLPPSVEAASHILHHCWQPKDRFSSLALFSYLSKSRLDVHPSLGNSLLCFLSRHDRLLEAHRTLDNLIRLEMKWSFDALFIDCVKCGHPHHALSFYKRLPNDIVSPLSGYAFVALLKASKSLCDVETAMELHEKAFEAGILGTNVFVGCCLVDFYVKCGMLTKAQEAFDVAEARNVVLWTALIAGYVEHGCGKEALDCFKNMLKEEIEPNAITLSCVLKACGILEDIRMGKELHSEIGRQGLLDEDHLVGNALIDMYAKCGLILFAREVFDRIRTRDVVAWTSLIDGYANNGYDEEGLICFDRICIECVCPDHLMSICGLKVCRNVGTIQKGKEMHTWLQEQEGSSYENLTVGNTLLDMYVKFGLLAEAREIFHKLPKKNIVSWSTLISGYAEDGEGEEALKCFNQMKTSGFNPDATTYACVLRSCASMGAMDMACEIHADTERQNLMETNVVIGNTLVDMYVRLGSLKTARDVFDRIPVRNIVSWNGLITGYADNGDAEEVLRCFEQMQLEGLSPNAITIVCTLRACGCMGAIEKGQEIHADIERKGFLVTDVLLGNTLVDTYAKCGLLHVAQQVFDRLSTRDVVAWNSLITGYAQLGESNNAFCAFYKMVREGVKPDFVTFLMVLNACTRMGLCDVSQTYFKSMSKDFGISPGLEHHSGMIDILCRTGHLDKALETIHEMPPKFPNLVVWRTLLSACRNTGNVNIGKGVFENVAFSGVIDASSYVLTTQTCTGVEFIHLHHGA